MATRKISTRLAIEGESAYKQAIRDCNNEIKTMRSELTLVQSQYQTSANSMEALKAKGEALGRAFEAQKQKVETLKAALENAQSAQQNHASATEEYRARLTAAQQELDRLKNSTGDTAEEQEKLQNEITELSAALEASEAKEQAAARGVSEWQRQLNYAESDLNDLGTEVQRNNQYMQEAEHSFRNTASSIDEFGNQTKGTVNAIDTLASSLAAAGVAGGLRTIAEGLKSCVAASVEFESAITGVFKTVDGTDEQLSAISDGIRQMATEIPATTTEIAAVAESAGQLGIATDDVLSFTRTMIDLGNSTNLTADEAASAFAKFANITGTAAEDYGRLGSTVVALGNNFATTEADIVAMSTRLASAGTLAGLSESEIMALATAMSSVGIEAEAGGTAMTQTLSAIESAAAKGGDSLQQFADVAGVSATEFAKLWSTSPITAIQKFIAGLGQLDEKGESAVLVLDEMGLSGVRQSNMLKSLALASDTLSGAVTLSSQAWSENTALSEEAGKRYATTESRIEMCKNAAVGLQAAIGDALTPALGNLADAGTEGFVWAAQFIEQNPALVQAFTAAAVAMGVVTASVTAYTVGVKAAEIATTAFNAILDANPMYLVGTAAVAAVAAFATLALTVDDDTESFSDMTEAARSAKDAVAESQTATADAAATAAASAETASGYVSRLRELQEQGNATSESQAEMSVLVGKLNALYPDLNLTIDENTGSLSENTEKLLENIEAQKQAAIDTAFDERKTELLQQQADVEVELATNRASLNDLREQENALTEENNSLNERNAEIYDELATLGDDDLARRAELESELYSNNEAINANAEAAADLRDQQQTVNDAIDEGTEASGELSDELDRLTEAMEQNAEASPELAEATAELPEELQKAAASAEQAYDAYVQLYNETAAKAIESIESQIGQWEKMDNTTKTSASTVQAALQSQVTYMQNYAANMQSLQNRNIEGIEQLAAALADGSTESAAILAGLAGATDAEIAQIVKSMGEVSAGKDAMADAMAGADTEVQAAMNKAVQAANKRDEMYRAGSDSAQGLINGLNSKVREASAAGSRAAAAYMAAYKAGMDQHSPSRAMYRAGQDTVQGLILGLAAKSAMVTLQARKVAQQMRETFTGSNKTMFTAGEAQIDALIDGFKSQETELKKQAEQAKKLLTEQFKDNDEAKELIDDYMDYYVDSIESTTKTAENFAKQTQSALDEIEDAWDEAAKKQESMVKRLSDYGDLFQEKDGRYQVEDLNKQIDALNRYEEVLTRLRDERGISDDLLDEIASMNIDDAIGYGEKLLAMSDDKFEDYVTAWETKQQRALEIAQKFYQSEFQALSEAYGDTLTQGLEELNNIGYGSGKEFAQYLMDGMKSQESAIMAQARRIASEVRATIDAALSFSGSSSKSSSKKNGSHAAGLDYVPFDGYIAELHKGERVLTASETQAYMDANTPSGFTLPQTRQLAEQQTAALVNAIGTLTAGAAAPQQDGSATIILQTGEGMEIARWLLPSIRAAAKQSPEVERDF